MKTESTTELADNASIDEGRIPNPEFYSEMAYPDRSPVYPYIKNYPKAKPEPTFLETIDAARRKHGDFQIIGRRIADTRDINQEREEGFDAIAEGLLDGIPHQHYQKILDQPTKEDAYKTHDRIKQEMNDDEVLNRAGWVKTLVSVGNAYAPWESPSSFLIPFGVPVKALTIGRGAIAGGLHFAKYSALIGGIKNAAIYGYRETGTFKEALYDTASDVIIGSLVGATYGAIGTALNMKAPRVAAEAMDKNVDVAIQLNKDSLQPEKLVAIPYKGLSVGAMEADIEAVQRAIDKNDVSFLNNNGIKNTFSACAPIVGGYTDQSPTVRKIFKTLYRAPFEIAGGDLDAIPFTALYDEHRFWMGQREKVVLLVNQWKLDNNKIKGVSREAQQIYHDVTGKTFNHEQYAEDIAKAVRRDGEWPQNPNVAKSAKEYIDLYDNATNQLMKEIPEFKKHTSTNIKRYLNRRPHILKIKSDPEGFMSDLSDMFVAQNKSIDMYNAPIENATKNFENSSVLIKELKEDLKKIKSPTDRAKLKEKIRKNYEIREGYQSDITAAKKEFALKAEAPDFDINLLEPKPSFSTMQIGELERLGKPLAAATEELENIKGEFKTLDVKEIEKRNIIRKKIESHKTNIKGINDKIKDYIEESSKAKPALKKNLKEQRKILKAAIDEGRTSELKQKEIKNKIRDKIKNAKAKPAPKKSLKEQRKILKAAIDEGKMLELKQKKVKNKIRDNIDNAKANIIKLENEIKEGASKIKEKRMVMEKNLTEEKKSLDSLFKGESKSKIQERKVIKEKIKKAKVKIEKEQQFLRDEYVKGKIEPSFVRESGKKITLHDPKQMMPILNKKVPADKIPGLTESIMLNYSGQSEEQTAGQIFGLMQSRGNDIFNSRVLLFNDLKLEKWLINDMETLSHTYIDQISKRIMLTKLLKNFKGKSTKGKLALENPDIMSKHVSKNVKFLDSEMEAMEGVAAEILTEKKLKIKETLKKPKSDSRTKELDKIDKKYNKSIKKVADGITNALGKYVDRGSGLNKFADSVKKLAVINMLGNVAITMLPEFATPLFRRTFDNYVRQGIVPAIKDIGKWGTDIIKKKGPQYEGWVIGKHADAGLSIQRYLSSSHSARQGFELGGASTKFERALDKGVHFSMNFNGANFVMDFQEKAGAYAAESSFIKILKRYASGEKIVPFDVNELDRARLNPKIWGKRVLAMFDEFGEPIKGKTKDANTYISNYHLWTDFEAKKTFATAIRADVRNNILVPNAMDRPLIMSRHPLLGMATLFTSYIFGATSAFTLPALTNFDRRKLQGIALTMALASTVGALRQFSRGDKVDLKPKTLFNEAIVNSAMLGYFGEYGIRANAYLDIPGTRWMMGDKFRSKYNVDLGGPVTSMMSDTASIIRSIVNGEYNQRDGLRLLRLTTGVTHNMATARLYRAIAKSSSKYETRAEAHRRKGH